MATATALAGQSRGLTLAAADEPASAAAPAKSLDVSEPSETSAAPAESRIIDELHRHGIYWW